MNPKRTRRAIFKPFASLLAIAIAAATANADTITKADNADPLNQETSWVGGVVPGAADIALWDSTVAGTLASSLGANMVWQGMQITNPGGTVQITGARSLTLGASGIDASTTTRTLQFQNDYVNLGADQTWNFGAGGALNIQTIGVNTDGHTLTINSTNAANTLSTISDIAGTGGLRITGGGVFQFGADSTYTGNTTIEDGSTVQIGRSGGTGSISSASEVTSTTSGLLQFTRNNDFEFANKISGNVSVRTLAEGTTTMSGDNTYTGRTQIFFGGIRASSLNSVGADRVASSSLGAPVTATDGMISLGFSSLDGQLTYTGAGETTDRIIQLRGSTGGAIIDHSGSGLLKFTSSTQAVSGAKSLILQGSTAGRGEFSGDVIDDAGLVGVAKSGTGTWILSGVNTYSGGTTVSDGTLLINTEAAAGRSGTGTGSVTVTNGVLGGGGIIAPTGANSVTLQSGAVLAPGDSIVNNGFGTLVVDGGATSAPLLVMESGAELSFQLGGGLASDKLDLWNYTPSDLVLNSNVLNISFVEGAGAGTYNLFNFYSGDGTGLTASGITSGLTVNFLNGGAGTLDYSSTGQINLIVTAVPEPSTWMLLAGAGLGLFLRRRKSDSR